MGVSRKTPAAPMWRVVEMSRLASMKLGPYTSSRRS